MNAQIIKERLRTNRDKLFSTYPLSSMALFGSYADGTATEESDVDILVEFYRPVGIELIDLSIELENILRKKVDITTRKAVKPGLMQFIEKQLQYV